MHIPQYILQYRNRKKKFVKFLEALNYFHLVLKLTSTESPKE